MKRPEFLKAILKDMAIKPRYVQEHIEYLNIPDMLTISFPMSCFCDIPLSKVNTHMEYYGEYGIALDKRICLGKDFQPITYLNINSRFTKDFSDSLKLLFSEEEEIEDKWKYLPNFLLNVLLYSKPIEGIMSRYTENDERIFQDECEWRYIPQLPSDMYLILPENMNTDKGRETFSKALALNSNKSSWLHFEVDDLVYIIVPDENAAIDIMSYIKRLHISRNDKDKLISKIEIANRFDINLI